LEEIALFNETEILLKKRESLFHCFWREFFFPKWEKIYYPGIESIDSKHYVTTLLQHLVRHCNDEEDGTMSTVMSHITITKKQYLKILQQDQALYLTWLLYFQGQMPLHCLNGAIDYHSEVLLGFEQIFASFELKLQQKTRVQFFEMLVLCITLVIIILNYVMHQRGEKGFFSEAVLFIFALSVLGIFFFLLATDFIFLYLSIELISLSLYVLVASEKVNLKSVEAGLKYFVVGSFTSLIYLLGSALLYGYFATLEFDALKLLLVDINELTKEALVVSSLGIFLIFSSIIFKLSAFPFHFITPDVYEGSPYLILIFVAVLAKLPFFIFLLYFFIIFLQLLIDILGFFLWFMALGSLMVGSLGALAQNSLKRFLAYSSISNIGFVIYMTKGSSFLALVGISFYFLLYLVVLLVFLGVVFFFRDSWTNNLKLNLSQIVSLSFSSMYLAVLFSICVLSFSGLPPFPLFISKYLLLTVLFDNGSFIDFFAIITFSSLNFYLYLKLILLVFFRGASFLNTSAYHLLSRGARGVLLFISLFLFLFVFILFNFGDLLFDFIIFFILTSLF